jgi:hypothetical protein
MGLPAGVIAGAMLAHLDRGGATLPCDAAGAHTTTVTFDPPAAGVADMAAHRTTYLTVRVVTRP